MPQLDTLTFFSQAITLCAIIPFFFILMVAVVLPTLFRIQKVRAFFCSRIAAVDLAFTPVLSKLLQAQAFMLSKTFLDSTEVLENLMPELHNVELSSEINEVIDEISMELCLETFDFFVFADEDEEFYKSNLFDLDDAELDEESQIQQTND